MAGYIKLVPRFCFLLVAGILMQASASQAQPEGKPAWRLDTEASEAFLTYGTDNAEELVISFSCKTGGGTIHIFIAETGEDLKPEQPVIASLVASAVTSKVKGNTRPNELAGVPSFEGELPASDPLFKALSTAGRLVMKVGKSSQEAPLQDIGDKADKFISACRKS
jgi:hypothetical protein